MKLSEFFNAFKVTSGDGEDVIGVGIEYGNTGEDY